LLFEELFPGSGFYVDVGAHHPDRFSVTRKLYDKGWQGINIDFSPNFRRLFNACRPRDINVECLIGRPRTATFHRFVEPTLSTLDPDRASQLIHLGWELACLEELPVRTLQAVLDEAGAPRRVDLLSVDVEGEDYEVLASLDWEQRMVERVLVEIVEPAFDVRRHPVAQLLESHGLHLTRVWGRSCLFERGFMPDPLIRRS
jgi:FkbM family methyltransferase